MSLPLLGLILRGGASRRMASDKAELSYHGVPEVERLDGLLSEVCEQVFFSVAPGAGGARCIEDPERHAGPLVGILAAFDREPGAAWLVVACDMPGLDRAGLAALIAARDAEGLATCFRAVDGAPEPLLCVYEPRIVPTLEAARAAGRMSPRRCLQKAGVVGIEASNPDWLLNINDPDARAAWLARCGPRPS